MLKGANVERTTPECLSLYNIYLLSLAWQGPVAMPMERMAFMDAGVNMMQAAPAPMAFRSLSGASKKTELKPVQRVRKLFPETWLWKSAISYVSL